MRRYNSHCGISSATVLTSLLLHKMFTWPDFGRVYMPEIPRRYTPLFFDSHLGAHQKFVLGRYISFWEV